LPRLEGFAEPNFQNDPRPPIDLIRRFGANTLWRGKLGGLVWTCMDDSGESLSDPVKHKKYSINKHSSAGFGSKGGSYE
jgi:hypothetical protein